MLEIKKRVRQKAKGPPSTTYYISGTYEGHRVRESLGVTSREAAQRKFEQRRKEIIEAVDAGRDPDLRFASAATEYINADKDDRFLDPLICELGETRIADLTTPMVHEAAKKLYPNAKPSTRNRQVIAPLMAVVNYCAEKRLCPPICIERFPEGKVSKVAIDREWVDKFRSTAIEKGRAEIGDMELMMFTTAARLGDCEKLEWPDVRIEQKIATLRQTKNDDDRDAILTPELARALAARRPRDGKGRVFPFTYRRQLYRDWASICKAARIEYVPPHQAGRHSFATEMIVRNKVDVKTTADLGGWKSPKLLLERYTHPEGNRQVVEDVFGGTKESGRQDGKVADTKTDAKVVRLAKNA